MKTFYLLLLMIPFWIPENICAQITYNSNGETKVSTSLNKDNLSKRVDIDELYDSINKRTSEFTKEDWQVLIDAYWGEGSSTPSKLAIFDGYWNTINSYYAAFQNLDVDWNGLRDQYRPEIEAGVSHGRLVAIINVLSRALMETHLFMNNGTVNYNTRLEPGVPLFSLGKYGNNAHFGAALAPLPDSTLLVYKAFPEHPLGLVPGDKVLGYEGVPWKILYKKLLDAELPVKFGMMGSTEEALGHIYLSSAGLNWHLFDTIDIVKYATGDTMHYPTSLLEGQKGRISNSDQLPVSGVDFWQAEGPDVASLDTTDNFTWINSPDRDAEYFTWGILDNTNIGYLYVATLNNSFHSSFSSEFYNALRILIYDYQVEGLILDSRTNYGGSWSRMDYGFSLLFNEDLSLVKIFERCNGADHFKMCEGTNNITLSTDQSTYFDRPIAFLTGPGCISAGDQLALKIKHHPMARLFGKNTGGAFSAGMTPELLNGRADWWIAYPWATFYPVADPGNWLTHTGLEVDEEIWFDPDSVAEGVDNVVSRAVEWIQNKVHPYRGEISNNYNVPGETISTKVSLQNPNDHNVRVWMYLIDLEDGMTLDSVEMMLTNTDLYAADLNIPTSEQDFAITYKSYDMDEQEVQILPKVSQFTTRGPIVVADYTITESIRQDEYKLNLQLTNTGTEAMVNNLRVKVNQIEPCIDIGGTIANVDFLNAGDTKFADREIPISNAGCSDLRVFLVEVNIYEYESGIVYWVDTLEITLDNMTGARETLEAELPVSLNIFPNPFRNSTRIYLDLDTQQKIFARVLNQTGTEIEVVANEFLAEGNHKFNFESSNLPNGIYYIQLITGDGILTKRITKIE